jgi:hypothetical protein
LITGSSISTQVWADVFEGTEGPDRIIGTLEDDLIDSNGGNDANYGDARFDDGSGDDIIVSGGDADTDTNTRDGGREIFVCGVGEDTVTDFNAEEGDIATPDYENINP